MEERPCVMQGFLKKKKQRSWGWKERWFLLDSTHLHYYQNRYDPEPVNNIPLQNISGVRFVTDPSSVGLSTQQQHKSFILELRGVLMILLAESEADARKWKELIEKTWSQHMLQQKLFKESDISKREAIQIESLLHKRTTTSWGWHERYFVLENLRLNYYKDSRKSELVGSIPLDQSVILRESPHSFPGVEPEYVSRCFALLSFSKSTCFMAATQELKFAWVKNLSIVLQEIQHQSEAMDPTPLHVPPSSTPIPDLTASGSKPATPDGASSDGNRKSFKNLFGDRAGQLRRHSSNIFRKSGGSSPSSSARASVQFSDSQSLGASNTESMVPSVEKHTLHEALYSMRKESPESVWKPKYLYFGVEDLSYANPQTPKDNIKNIPMESIQELRPVTPADAERFPSISTEDLSLCCAIVLLDRILLIKADNEIDFKKALDAFSFSAVFRSKRDEEIATTSEASSTIDSRDATPAESDQNTMSPSPSTEEISAVAIPPPPQILVEQAAPLSQSTDFESDDILVEMDTSQLDMTADSSFSTLDGDSKQPTSAGKRYVTLIEGPLRKRAGSSLRWVQRTFSLRVFYTTDGILRKRLYYLDDHQLKGSIDIDEKVEIKEAIESGKSSEKKHFCFSLTVGSKCTILEGPTENDMNEWLRCLRLECTPAMFAEIRITPEQADLNSNSKLSVPKTDSSGSARASAKGKFMNSITKAMAATFLGAKAKGESDGTDGSQNVLRAQVQYKSMTNSGSATKPAFLVLHSPFLHFFQTSADSEPFKSVPLKKFNVQAPSEKSEPKPEDYGRSIIFEVDDEQMYITFDQESTRDAWSNAFVDILISAQHASSAPSIVQATPKSPHIGIDITHDVDNVVTLEAPKRDRVKSSSARTDLKTLAGFLPSIVIKRFSTKSAPLQDAEIEYIQAAVLFADVSGFTPLSEKLCKKGVEGAEKLSMYLNKYFENLTAVIRFFGGDTIKFAGDAVLAMWANGPLWLNTLLAVQCAVEMQGKLHAWKAGNDGEMSLHVGVGCGKVSALHVGGWQGQWEFFIMGNPLAQISVAEGQAKTGEVVISKEAWQLVKGHCVGTMVGNDGCFKIEKISNPLPSRIAPYPVVSEDMIPALRSYLQPVVNNRLTSGQASWLAELRRVTVMFLHLPIVELDETDPSSFDLLQNVTVEIQKAIHHWAGTIRQFMMDDKGSVLVVAFGLPPYSYENDAARCVMAAMELQETLRNKLGLASTVGITTGSVFCGAVGSKDRREYAVVGDVVNLSARLMVAARSTLMKQGIQSDTNNTLCDRATYDACRNAEVKQMRIRFKAIPPIKVKGKSEPISIYYPIGTIEASKSSLQHTARLVGRSVEWGGLKAHLDSLLGSKTGSVSLIEGDAGMGKSIMLAELKKTASLSDVKTLYGSADRIERTTPLFPWRHIISDSIGFGNYDHSGEDQRRFLLDYLRLIDEEIPPAKDVEGLSSRSLESLAPLMTCVLPKLEIPDNEVTEELLGDVRVDAAVEVLIRILTWNSKESTLVIIDNGQWFDSASWSFARQISMRIPNLMVVISLRPLSIPEPPRYTELVQTQGVIRMRLGPLSHEESVSMVCSTYGISQLPDSVARVITTRGQGNPFFIEEIMYRLFSSQVIKIVSGTCKVADGIDISTIPFPDSIQGVTRSRVDNLPTGPQFTLKVASVVGASFSVKMIKRIHPISADKINVEEDLQVLEQMDLITMNNDLSGENVDERVYVFRNIITEEVAYNLLLVEQRRQLHQAIGLYYESDASLMKSLSYERLAHHFTKAEVFDKAVRYLGLASREALDSNENKEAIYFLNKAWIMCEQRQIHISATDKSRLLLSQAEAYYRMGDMNKATSFLESALSIMGLPVPQGKMTVSDLSKVCDPQLVAEYLRECNRPVSLQMRKATRAHSIVDTPVACLVYEKLGYVYFLTNDRQKLIDAVVYCSNHAISGGLEEDRFLLIGLLTVVSRIFGLHGYADAQADYALGVTYMCGMQSLPKIYTALAFSGMCCGGGVNLWEKYLSYIETAHSLFDAHGFRRNARESMYLKAMYFYYCGDFKQTVAISKQLADLGRQHLDLQSVWWGVANQARALLLLDQADAAIKLLMEGKQILDRSNYSDPFVRLELFAMLALTRLKRGYHFVHVALEAVDLALQDAPPESTANHHHVYTSYAMLAEVIMAVLKQLMTKSSDCPFEDLNLTGSATFSANTATDDALDPMLAVVASPTSVAAYLAKASAAAKGDRSIFGRRQVHASKSFSVITSTQGGSASFHSTSSLPSKDKARKGSELTQPSEKVSRTVNSERKRLEKMFKIVLDLMARHAQNFPIAKAQEYIWHANYELYTGSVKQALKIWAKGLERAEKTQLPWEQVQSLFQLSQYSLDETERTAYMQKLVQLCEKCGWK